jgi:hypothetical protein
VAAQGYSRTLAQPSVSPLVRLRNMLISNNEVEVACDALWFVKSRAAADAAQERAWDRLQELRTGDFGGSASAELTSSEADAVLRALRACADEIPLDDDERRLLDRLDPATTVRRHREHWRRRVFRCQNRKGDQQGTRSYPRRRSAVSIATSTREVMPGTSTGRRPAT